LRVGQRHAVLLEAGNERDLMVTFQSRYVLAVSLPCHMR